MTRSDPDHSRARLADALSRVGAQDRAAFRTVYLLTSAKLFGICVRICGDRQAAEDVVHDVYVTVWQRAAGYDPARASPITWLATIARNRAIDWRRANARYVPQGAAAAEAADDAPLAGDRMLEDETARQLHACLDGIEERQRRAITDAFFGGYTYAELAERRAVPLGTMKSWVRRGLANLKACLDAFA